MTVDVDATLLTGFGTEEPYIDQLLSEFAPRVSEARAFALAHRVLLLRSSTGVGLDIALGALPFEESVVERSSLFEFPPGLQLRTCSAEDLVVMKAFASRTQDWADVEKIVVRGRSSIAWQYVTEQLTPLCELKGEPEILERLEELKRRHGHD